MKWLVLEAAAPSTELWGYFSLLFCHYNNWGRPKFITGELPNNWGIAKVYRQRTAFWHCSHSTNSSCLSRAAGKSPHGCGWCTAEHNLARWCSPTSALALRERVCATLHCVQTALPDSQWGSIWVPLLQTNRQNHTIWEILPLVHRQCLPACYVAKVSHLPPWKKLSMLWNDFFN